MALMSQKTTLAGGMLEGQTVEMGFAAGEFPLWSHGTGGGERRGRRGTSPHWGSWGQSRIKAPELSLGEN